MKYFFLAEIIPVSFNIFFNCIITVNKYNSKYLKEETLKKLFTVEISFYFNSKEEINEINIMINILFDVYKIQKNVVLINYKSKINSYIFSFSDREKTFIY